MAHRAGLATFKYASHYQFLGTDSLMCLSRKIGLFLSRLNRALYRPAILAMHDKDDGKQPLADGPLLDAEERKAIFNVLDSFR